MTTALENAPLCLPPNSRRMQGKPPLSPLPPANTATYWLSVPSLAGACRVWMRCVWCPLHKQLMWCPTFSVLCSSSPFLSLPLSPKGADEKGPVCQHATLPEDEGWDIRFPTQDHCQPEVCPERGWGLVSRTGGAWCIVECICPCGRLCLLTLQVRWQVL